MSDHFETAYKRAREKIGADRWPALSNQEKERAVAEALHALKSENGQDRRDPET